MHRPQPCLHTYCMWKRGAVTVRIMIPIQKLANSSTRLWHYMVNSFFSNVIDREATKVPYSSVHSHSMNSAPINSAPCSSSLQLYSYSYLTIQLASYTYNQLAIELSYIVNYTYLAIQLPAYLAIQLATKLQLQLRSYT